MNSKNRLIMLGFALLGMVGLLTSCGGGGGGGSGASVGVSSPAVAYASWDTAWSVPGVTFTNGNLSISGNSASTKNVRSDIGVSTGKWYWEVLATGGNGVTNAGGIGIVESIMPNSTAFIGFVNSGLSFGYNCCKTAYFLSWPGVTLPSGGPPTISGVNTGIRYMFALDMDTGDFWAGQDGTWYNAGDPGTNTNPAASGLTGTVYPGVTLYANSINAFTANFGASAFTHSVPTGFNSGLYTAPTWDTAWSVPGVTFTDANLSISGNSANTKNVRTVTGKSTGKWYWEVLATGGNGVATNAGGLGIAESVMPNNTVWIGSVSSGLSFGYGNSNEQNYFFSWPGVTLPSGAPPAGSSVNTGTVYMFALDMDTGDFWAGQDGTWYNAGDPGTNANPAASGLTGTVYPGVTFYNNSINAFTANFGASAFTYTQPVGFLSYY